MKKIIVLLISITSLSLTLKAQDGESYRNAIGVRLSSSLPVVNNGITFKHFIGNNAIEGILSFGNGTAVCVLYEVHKSMGVENLQWLYGAGGYIGFSSNSTVGAAGIIGLDYKFPIVPLNLTLDWKPELNLISKIGFEPSGIGFSARFAF